LLLDPAAPRRLERSCGRPSDWLRVAPSRPGLERVEAFFSGHAYDPHRHDTYAIGITLHGVQSFRYRGAPESSTLGQAFVLHPDELHDGHAGTPAGFGYRILYLEPRLIQDALEDAPCPLPFVRDAVSNDARLTAAITPALPISKHRSRICTSIRWCSTSPRRLLRPIPRSSEGSSWPGTGALSTRPARSSMPACTSR